MDLLNKKNLLKAKHEFSKYGVTVTPNQQKNGTGGSWIYADNTQLFIEIQKPLLACGLDTFTTLSENTLSVTLVHVATGESITSTEYYTKEIRSVPTATKASAIDSVVERKLIMKLLRISEVKQNAFTKEWARQENLVDTLLKDAGVNITVPTNIVNFEDLNENDNEKNTQSKVDFIKSKYQTNKTIIDTFVREHNVKLVTNLSMSNIDKLIGMLV